MFFFRSVRDSLDLLGSERRWRWGLLVVLSLLVTVFETLGAVLIYVLISAVTSPENIKDVPVLGDVHAAVDVPLLTFQIWLAALVAGFFVLRAAVTVTQQYVQNRLVLNAAGRLSSYLVRGYLEVPYEQHVRRNSSESVRNAFDSVQSLTVQVLRPTVEVIAEATLVVGLSVLLLIVAPSTTLVALLVLGPVVWAMQRFVQPRLKDLGRQSQTARGRALQALQQSLEGLREIRLARRESWFADAFGRERLRMARAEYLWAALAFLPRAMVEAAIVLVIVLVFVLSLLTGEGAEAAIATLGVFAYVGMRLTTSLRSVVAGLNWIRYGSAVLEDLTADRQRVDRLLRERAEVADDGEEEEPPFQSDITLRDVSFAYASDGPNVLVGVSLVVRRGESLGICGPTGGGKSTLVDIVAGLLDPTRGTVCVDGVPVADRRAWWYRQLGVVSQNVFLIDDTLRRNIAFGEDDDRIDEDRLGRAVARAQLTAVVAELPEGLDTVVGERGVRLSGGQRQRVAVARSLYHEPPVIIFDEGTSALDATTEAAVVSALGELRSGRTLLSVAHRIGTVREADRIVVVESGRIVAEGTFDELLARSELFRALAR